MYTIMNTIDITEPYCIKKARELYETGLLKDHLDCKNYLNQYFFSACDGTVFMKMLEPYKFHQKIVMHHEWSILRKEDLKDKLSKSSLPNDTPQLLTELPNIAKQSICKDMLQMDPEIRPTAKKLMSDPWIKMFDAVIEEQEEILKKKEQATEVIYRLK